MFMERSSEIPDAHIADLAQQFLGTAVLLREHLPRVVAPSALAVNAAFAIELFIKSLDSHWECHSLTDELGIDGAYEMTAKSNTRGHDLSDLFAKLPISIRQGLEAAFAAHELAQKHESLVAILGLYSCTFERERYGFEQRAIETTPRHVKEIVALGEFFAGFVAKMKRVRYWEP